MGGGLPGRAELGTNSSFGEASDSSFHGLVTLVQRFLCETHQFIRQIVGTKGGAGGKREGTVKFGRMTGTR